MSLTIGLRTYVINLARRPDRRARMERVLPPFLQLEFTTKWPGPVDGRRIGPADLRGYTLFPWRIDSANPWWNRPLKTGEIACSVSHLSCWQRARADSAGMCLILEDDVSFVADVEQRLEWGLRWLAEHDPGWDLVYLGREPLAADEPVVDGLVRPGYSHCSFAYAVSSRGLDKLTGAGLHRAVVPVDEFLPAMYCPHPRADLRAVFPPRCRAYAFDPPLVVQLPKSVAGSDTEDSSFVDLQWTKQCG